MRFLIQDYIMMVFLLAVLFLGGHVMYQINTTDWHGGVKAIIEAQNK